MPAGQTVYSGPVARSVARRLSSPLSPFFSPSRGGSASSTSQTCRHPFGFLSDENDINRARGRSSGLVTRQRCPPCRNDPLWSFIRFPATPAAPSDRLLAELLAISGTSRRSRGVPLVAFYSEDCLNLITEYTGRREIELLNWIVSE